MEGEIVWGDLYDISSRIREIDDGYFLLRRRGKYEVHNRKDRSSYCLTLPFGELDARAVEFVLRTRAERAQALFEEMDAHNRRLEAEERRAASDRILSAAEEGLSGPRRER